MSEGVEHPTHYTYGSIECWDYIAAQGFCYFLGNVVKYVTRAHYKRINGNEEWKKDLRKAREYINKYFAVHDEYSRRQAVQEAAVKASDR